MTNSHISEAKKMREGREAGNTLSSLPELDSIFKSRFKSEYITVDNTRIHCVKGGKGPPLLLIPGWPQTWFAWRKIMPVLSDSFTVVAVDPRGIGLSDKPSGGYDLGTVGNELVSAMKKIGYPVFDVIGHDVGMWIAYAMAADHPRAVKRVVVADAMIPGISNAPPLFMPSRQNERLWHFAFNRAPDINEILVQGREYEFVSWQFTTKSATTDAFPQNVVQVYADAITGKEALRASFEYYRAIDENIAQNQARSAIKLSMPVLAIGGDRSAGAGVANTMRGVAIDVREEIIANSGHYVPEEAPETFLNVVLHFLSSENDDD